MARTRMGQHREGRACAPAQPGCALADADLGIVARSALFADIEPAEARALLGCLGAVERSYAKGERALRAGDRTSALGLVLEGAVRIEREDYWGTRSIIARIGSGRTFGEAFACAPELPCDVSAVAVEDGTRVLFLNAGKVMTTCPSSCAFHARLARNLLAVLARRAHGLTRKIDHVSKRTTRGKLLAYLSDEAARAGADEFSIPFDRQELADYLAVDRSAMCAELSRMRRDGVIDYRRERFRLLRAPQG